MRVKLCEFRGQGRRLDDVITEEKEMSEPDITRLIDRQSSNQCLVFVDEKGDLSILENKTTLKSLVQTLKNSGQSTLVLFKDTRPHFEFYSKFED